MPGTVLVTDHVFGGLETERAALAEIGYQLEQAPASDVATLERAARAAAGILVCYAQLPERVVRAAASAGCRIIARYGIGVDNVDVDAATRAGIQVTNVPDYCLDEVADHTLALLLAAARNLVGASRSVREGEWSVPQGQVHRLAGRRLALIGLGRIGRRVAARARPFGYDVVGYDPFVKDRSDTNIAPVESIQAAIAEADAISLHAPLTADTHHLIDDAAIDRMRRSPILINTSRGPLINLQAATRALDNGRLSALAIDVTEPEPLPADHPLRRHPRAIVTPHMSYYSAEAQHELQRRATDEVIAALTNQPPRCPVNQPHTDKRMTASA